MVSVVLIVSILCLVLGELVLRAIERRAQQFATPTADEDRIGGAVAPGHVAEDGETSAPSHSSVDRPQPTSHSPQVYRFHGDCVSCAASSTFEFIGLSNWNSDSSSCSSSDSPTSRLRKLGCFAYTRVDTPSEGESDVSVVSLQDARSIYSSKPRTPKSESSNKSLVGGYEFCFSKEGTPDSEEREGSRTSDHDFGSLFSSRSGSPHESGNTAHIPLPTFSAVLDATEEEVRQVYKHTIDLLTDATSPEDILYRPSSRRSNVSANEPKEYLSLRGSDIFPIVAPMLTAVMTDAWLTDNSISNFLHILVAAQPDPMAWRIVDPLILSQWQYLQASIQTCQGDLTRFHALRDNITSLLGEVWSTTITYPDAESFHSTCRAIFIPFPHDNTHWSLLAISGTDRCISVYDPLSSPTPRRGRRPELDFARDLLFAGLRKGYSATHFVERPRAAKVRQTDAINCGVWVCLHALEICHDNNAVADAEGVIDLDREEFLGTEGVEMLRARRWLLACLQRRRLLMGDHQGSGEGQASPARRLMLRWGKVLPRALSVELEEA